MITFFFITLKITAVVVFVNLFIYVYLILQFCAQKMYYLLGIFRALAEHLSKAPWT